MDRNDRTNLPGFHEMIARGLHHSLYGGPDHIDSVHMKQPLLSDSKTRTSVAETQDTTKNMDSTSMPRERATVTSGIGMTCFKLVFHLIYTNKYMLFKA